jgi:ABC-type lipoprotein export system ATPase subunit
VLLDSAARGVLVVVATHDPEVADCCDDWFELVEGHLTDVGPED